VPAPGHPGHGAPAASGRPNDSVDVLLEGIPGGPPQGRARTAPQSDGQASAAYHAQHAVRPAQTSPDELPKVLVDRPQPGPTLRLDRAKLIEEAPELFGGAAGDVAGAAAGAQEREMEPTVVAPPAMGPRIVVAIAAGVVVVMALFVGLKMMSAKSGGEAEEPGVTGVTGVTGVSGVTGATPGPTATGATMRAAGAVTAVATSGATAMPTAASEPPAVGEPSAASTAAGAPAQGAPRHAHARAAASAHAKPKPASAAAPGGNLGEFKTTF